MAAVSFETQVIQPQRLDRSSFRPGFGWMYDKFYFHSPSLRFDLIFELDARSMIPKTLKGNYIFAQIRGTNETIAICLAPDSSRGANVGDMYKLDVAGTFTAEDKIPNSHFDIEEFEYHLQTYGFPFVKSSGTDPSKEQKAPIPSFLPLSPYGIVIPDQKTPTIGVLLGNLKRLAGLPNQFMQNNSRPLSESHGCIHISPGDAPKLRSWVGIGSRIVIHKYGEEDPVYNEENSYRLLPMLERSEFDVDPKKVLLEIYPKPSSQKIGGIGIISIKMNDKDDKYTPIGIIKLTPGPETVFTDSAGNHAGPTREADTVITSVEGHISEKYNGSKIPGGSQVTFDGRTGNRSYTEVAIKGGGSIQVPTLFYRKFDYAANAYSEPPQWIEAPQKFMQYLFDNDFIDSSGVKDASSWPFETRQLGKAAITYYIGHSFGNGEILPSGERVPHIVFKWNTQEFIHYGGQEETEANNLTTLLNLFFSNPEAPLDQFMNNAENFSFDKSIDRDFVQKFLSSTIALRALIWQQAKLLGLSSQDIRYIIDLYLKGFIDSSERILRIISDLRKDTSPDAIAKELPINPEKYFTSDMQKRVKIYIFDTEVIITRKETTKGRVSYSIIINPKNLMTAFDKLCKIAVSFGAGNQIPQSQDEYAQIVAAKRKGAQNQDITQFLSWTVHATTD